MTTTPVDFSYDFIVTNNQPDTGNFNLRPNHISFYDTCAQQISGQIINSSPPSHLDGVFSSLADLVDYFTNNPTDDNYGVGNSILRMNQATDNLFGFYYSGNVYNNPPPVLEALLLKQDLIEPSALIPDATGPSDVVETVNSVLAQLRAQGLQASS